MIKSERKKLEQAFSIDFLIEKVCVLKDQGEKLKNDKQLTDQEFNSYFHILNENQKKLYFEVRF